ncbi:MAG: STAS domain-containing protein [Chitinispirillales bacterium]|jgi:anti-anti-sigma factor|nr:STAS domain-containing protein [Chitinispirillales bacterium]
MEITKTLNEGKTTFTLVGRLDTVSASEFQSELIAVFDEAEHVVLDFKDVAYVSSAGLRVLLLGEKTAKAKGRTMDLVNVSADIKEVFNMTGFTAILKIV